MHFPCANERDSTDYGLEDDRPWNNEGLLYFDFCPSVSDSGTMKLDWPLQGGGLCTAIGLCGQRFASGAFSQGQAAQMPRLPNAVRGLLLNGVAIGLRIQERRSFRGRIRTPSATGYYEVAAQARPMMMLAETCIIGGTMDGYSHLSIAEREDIMVR